MKGQRKQCGIIFTVLLLFILFLDGCSVVKEDKEKIGDLEYTVVKPEELPEELKKQIEEQKDTPMKISYGDQGMLYIVRGYGEKDTDGYQAVVNELYETKHTIYIQTSLKGPESEADAIKKKTYPYVVVKMPFHEKKIRFEG